MPDIRILPDRVANQIAAGEVIERPAAAVKELVENALDAGATRIEVEFRHGGRSLMRIEDNGHGMNRANAELSLARHATSKIKVTADLDELGSFGFRGEALPSIASVSKFTLQTRAQGEELGSEVLVNAGQTVHVRDCGRPVGTRIEVEHLFHSVPARRKFLKQDRTEAAHIVAGVRLHALASPAVAFTLIEDGRVVFQSPECPALADRVAEIFGRQLAEKLIPLDVREGSFTLHGLIGKPGVGRSSRHEMNVFVNGRPVENRPLNYALIESYHESLPQGRYPPAFLFFTLPPHEVDVNVHPAKREVRFCHERQVRAFVVRSVLQKLREFSAYNVPLSEKMVASASSVVLLERRGTADRPGGPAISPEDAPAPSIPPLGTLPQLSPDAPAIESVQPIREVTSGSPRGWRFIGVAHALFGLFETTAGVVWMHRRAAHERIWFERLQQEFGQQEVASQQLLLPVPVELDPISSALLTDRLEFLYRHGLGVSEFGRHFYRIESIPTWMEPAAAEPFLHDLLGALREGRFPSNNVELAREELARLASAKAVRLPEIGGETHWQTLLEQLFDCQTPLTSPAGRPTIFEMPLSEIAQRFHR